MSSKPSDPQETNSRHRCSRCSALSPETETNYTLISSRHGWRLRREFDAEGQKTMRWYCPSCWRQQREAASK